MNYETILPPDAPRDVWLAERRKGIASSDVAALCGLSQWGTALECFLEKRGLMPERFQNTDMSWGTRLEPVIAQAYADREKVELEIPPKLVRSLAVPWMLASLDRVVKGSSKIVECKNVRVTTGWGDVGTDEVPEQYLLQCTHQLMVTGAEVCDVAVLFGGSDFRVYTVNRHEKLEAKLMLIESDFWRMHERNEAPEPDWTHPSTPDLIAHACQVDDEAPVAMCGPELAALWSQWQAYGDVIAEGREADKQRKVIKARIEHAMGKSAKAVFTDQSNQACELYRKTINNRGYTVSPFEYTVLSEKPPKGK